MYNFKFIFTLIIAALPATMWNWIRIHLLFISWKLNIQGAMGVVATGKVSL